MKDRLVAGALAGAVAALVQDAYGLTVKALGITDRIFTDFAAVMIMFKPEKGALGFLVGLIAHVIVGIIFGIVFAYIILKTSSNYFLLKGLCYGLILWFLLLGLGTMWRLPLFTVVPPKPALVIFVGALLYGLVTAYILKLLDQRTNLI